MNEKQVPWKRVRINVSTSVKGVKTWDATVEITDDLAKGDLIVDTLAESDRLVAALEERYPGAIGIGA